MKNRLPRSTPESQGISSSAILAFVEAAQDQIQELHSLMLIRHGQVVAEGWWSPYAPEKLHMLFSLSKSFTSSAIGLAVGEGRLSIDDRVLSFFPDDVPAEISPNLSAMRVRHLLSMSTGHAMDTTPLLFEGGDNWIKTFLSLPVEHEPGTFFLYNTGATYMLSAIIQKITGMKLIDYLTPRLLEPLGIEDTWWEESPQGINMGGFGFNVKTEDIACFGQMYLQRGLWNGKQILSEAWVELASSKHISNGTDPNSDWAQGYGFQFWRCRHNAYRGDGAFGQYCIVMPEQDAVLAITSGVGDMQQPLNFVWDMLLPAMGDTPLPENSAAQTALMAKLASLEFAPPPGESASPTAARVSGRDYKADANDLQMERLCFEFGDSSFTAVFTVAGKDHPMTGGYGRWEEGSTNIIAINRNFPEKEHRCVTSGVWTAENTFTITTRFYETPFYGTVIIQFETDHLTMESFPNVAFVMKHELVTAQAT